MSKKANITRPLSNCIDFDKVVTPILFEMIFKPATCDDRVISGSNRITIQGHTTAGFAGYHKRCSCIIRNRGKSRITLLQQFNYGSNIVSMLAGALLAFGLAVIYFYLRGVNILDITKPQLALKQRLAILLIAKINTS